MVPSAESAGAAKSNTHATTRKICIVCRLDRSVVFGSYYVCLFKRHVVVILSLSPVFLLFQHHLFLLISAMHKLRLILNRWEWTQMQFQEIKEMLQKILRLVLPLGASSTGVPRVIVRWELVDFCTGDPHQGKGVARGEIWTIYCDFIFSSIRFFYITVLASNESKKRMKTTWRNI